MEFAIILLITFLLVGISFFIDTENMNEKNKL